MNIPLELKERMSQKVLDLVRNDSIIRRDTYLSVKGRFNSSFFWIRSLNENELSTGLNELLDNYNENVLPVYFIDEFAYDITDESEWSFRKEPSFSLVKFWDKFSQITKSSLAFSSEETVFISLDQIAPINLYMNWKDQLRHDKPRLEIFDSVLGKMEEKLLRINRPKTIKPSRNFRY